MLVSYSGSSTTDTFTSYVANNGPAAVSPNPSLMASYCWGSTASTPTAVVALPVATTGGSISMWYPLYTIK